MAAEVAVSVRAPRIDHPAYGTVSKCVMRDPGWSIQFRMVISARVMPPWVLFTNERLLSTCPRKEMKTVTKDNSMVLANKAVSNVAVDGCSLPWEDMPWP